METSRPQKKRLRAVLLVSAVGAVACGSFDADEPPAQRAEGGDGDEVAPVIPTSPLPDTVGLVGLPAGDGDEPGGAGAGNHGDGPGGAGGESFGSNGFVGIAR